MIADLLSWWPWSSPQWSYVHTLMVAIMGTVIERHCNAAGRPGTPVRLRNRTLVFLVFVYSDSAEPEWKHVVGKMLVSHEGLRAGRGIPDCFPT